MADNLTEAQLCESYAKAAERAGWEVYPELAGWDLVLVAREHNPPRCVFAPRVAKYMDPEERIVSSGVPAGTQIGIEAKRRGSIEQLAQIISRMRHNARPDYAMALVGAEPSRSFDQVAVSLGVGVVDWPGDSLTFQASILPPNVQQPWRGYAVMGDVGRLELPSIRTHLSAAGTASPKVLTKWRRSALLVCHQIERNGGTITRPEIQALGCNPTTWVQRKWLAECGKRGRLKVYRPRRKADGTLCDGFPSVGWEGYLPEVVAAAAGEEA